MLRAAAVQLASGSDPQQNLERIGVQVRAAAAAGARLVVLPENCLYRGPQEHLPAVARAAVPALREACAQLARAHALWLVAGGVPLPQDDKVANTALVYNPAGDCTAQYRKLHLFDVDLGETLCRRESDHFVAGDEVGMSVIDGIVTGLAICYDLRFSELFRRQSGGGAELCLLPADFTLHTGRAHWDILVRARAIENQFFLIAPNQAGSVPQGGESYGHSLIVGPWGEVLAACGDETEGLAVADLDFAYLRRVRAELPVLTHRRPLRGGLLRP